MRSTVRYCVEPLNDSEGYNANASAEQLESLHDSMVLTVAMVTCSDKFSSLKFATPAICALY
jgi:hypothetical protein